MLRGLYQAVRRVNGAIAWVVTAVSMAIVAFAVVALLASAVERYVSGIGYAWMNDFPPYLMPWCVFPMLGVLLRRGRHITVEVAQQVLRGTGLRVLRLFVAAVCLAAGIAFTVAGVHAVAFFRSIGQVTETEIEVPLWWLFAAFPTGFGLFSLFALEGMLRELVLPAEPAGEVA